MLKAELTNFEPEPEGNGRDANRESTNKCNMLAHLPDTPRGIARVYSWAASLTGCNEDRAFYVSYGNTAKFLSRLSPSTVSRDSVRRGIERLCELGMFVKLEKPGPDGTNQYRVIDHDCWANAHPNQCWNYVPKNERSKAKPSRPAKAGPAVEANGPRAESSHTRPSDTGKPEIQPRMVVGGPEHTSLMADLARVCDRQAAFTLGHQSELAGLCNEFSVEEVVSAFKDYWNKLVDSGKPAAPYLAANNFVVNARGWIQDERNIHEKRIRDQRIHEATKKRLQEEAEAERRQAEEREKEQETLFDPLLGSTTAMGSIVEKGTPIAKLCYTTHSSAATPP